MSHQIPSSLLSSLQDVKGFDLSAFIDAHNNENTVTSIRLNPNKKIDVAKSNLSISANVPWSSHGYYLTERPSFTTDPFFHAGAYYVQEASSMFLEQCINQTCELDKSLKVLDLCAAPGGKSTLIQSLISSDSLLVSNEVIKSRVNILSENITKWGAVNTVVTNNDPKDFQRIPSFFDLIVVDAPCSGSGLFRKDPNAINEWSEDNVTLCCQRQQRILADIIHSLKPNGTLIYSTCSYSINENEHISDWLIENYQLESVSIQLNQDWNIIETISNEKKAFGYRFYPDKVKGEGFFIAVFKKPDVPFTNKFVKPKSKLEFISKTEMMGIKNWINEDNSLTFFKWQQNIIAFRENLIDDLLQLQSSLYIKKAGVNIGSTIRNELIPSHDLAVSTILNNNIIAVDLSKEDSLQYLRQQNIGRTIDERGWILIRFEGIALGFIKAMPNRINNYYPREWRIINK
jgi:NOL1/NOP2/sun family putative RNA methylase